MAESFLYSGLKDDQALISEFDMTHVARTESAFCDNLFRDDVERIKQALEDQDNLGPVTRIGNWIYNFYRSPDHPRGVWRRQPDGQAVSANGHWQTVFDLDNFCENDGEEWDWRGVDPLWSEPNRVLIALSQKGSDSFRHLEWDCSSGKAVPGGFDTKPARSNATWLDPDTILLATTDLMEGATRSGWPRVVVKLERGMEPRDAPVFCEADYHDVRTYAYTYPQRDGSRGLAIVRYSEARDETIELHRNVGVQVLASPARAFSHHNDTHYAYVASDDGPDLAGSLVLLRLNGTDKRVLFKPSERRAVSGTPLLTKDFVFWVQTDTLTPTLWRLDLRRPDAAPQEMPLPKDAQTVGVMPFDVTGCEDGAILLATTGFLSPTEYWLFDQYTETPEYTCLTRATSSFDSQGMDVRLHMAVSDDGTAVPYHIVLPKNHADMMGDIPILQHGYGGFGAQASPQYLRDIGMVWLSRGGAYVQTYIRGGAEFGKAWHIAAKRENRHRSFEDFAAIATDLVKRGYTRPDKIACRGGSNGGLLCGVMLTRYPERFGAVWARVGVFDMMRFHKFISGAAWIEEFGDPDDPAARAWLLDYSPMHNVVDHATRRYPPALITTNDKDDRVDPSHSRRFAAILEEAMQEVWFHITAGGHGGGGKTSAIAARQALGYAFLRRSLQIN